MKKIALAIIVIVTWFSSQAQNANSDSYKNKKFHKKEKFAEDKNFANHNLTGDQKARIKTLSESFRQQMQDLNKNRNLSADEQKEKRQALVKEHKEKINAILTPEQRNEAKDMKHGFKGNKGKMHRQRFGETTKELNLSPEQSAKMKDLNASLRNNIQSIRQNTDLNQEEKKEQMKSLMKKHKADMEDLLTNEQKEKLKNTDKNRRGEAVK